MSQLVFIENVAMDTFIADKFIWETLNTLTQNIQDERNPTTRLRLRKERLTEFFEYMATQY